MSHHDQLGVPALRLLAQRSMVAVLRGLADGALRPSELERRIPAAGHSLVMRRLRHLLDRELVTYEHRPGLPPHARQAGTPHEARYSLSDPGRMLLEVADAASHWEQTWRSKPAPGAHAGLEAIKFTADPPTREIAILLADRPLPSKDLEELAELGRSALHRRLLELALAGLLERRKSGTSSVYNLTSSARHLALVALLAGRWELQWSRPEEAEPREDLSALLHVLAPLARTLEPVTGLCQLRLDGRGEGRHDLFSDLEDCFVAALEQALSEAAAFAREGYRSEFSWREGIRSALWRLLALMERNPKVARLLVVESLAVGPAVSVRRARVFSDLTELVDAVRAQPGRVREPPALTAEAVVGGACSVLYSRLIAEREPPLTELLGPLMSMIVLPYLGTAAAQRELDRPTPQAPLADSPVVASDAHALESLDIRLTYRTVRVLSAIAEHPGARNCEVAQAADIVDQGQVSKLLTRLSGLNLIENVAGANDRTGPKAWHLTALGAQLERAAGHQAKLAAGVAARRASSE